ncbi:DUF2726 domain-containing protein [Acinetobacter puyangensis]|uniref:DUF2726 domain-containing protein n=1 Tax=Acinetobacter puyangensis TaxID=1096779 RepID=UPI003A4DB737
MLYIILIGVIIFLALKLSKTSQISEQQIVDKVVKQIEDKMRLTAVAPAEPPRHVEPVVIVDKTPVPVFEKKVAAEPPKPVVEPIVLSEESIDDEDSEIDEGLSAEEEKKPLSEIIKRRIHHRKVLTLNEQPMFHRLKEALPEYSVLPQVSFNSLVWSRSKYIRNRFNRKVCDFAICDEAFKPIFVIELDDASHNGREQEDADRDCILNEAKIRVIRYKQTPEIEVIRRDVGLQ